MEFMLTDAEKKILLADARETIAAALEKREPAYHTGAAGGNPALDLPCGAFVTLRLEGELRGCIGRMGAAGPLAETARAMAREAAFGDPRFPPLEKEELGRCDIEISLLSPMELCPDPGEVRVGTHGLYLVHRGRAGVLLPQVPVEQGWDREEYLAYICVKAGLPPRSWEAPGAKLYTFTALVFWEAPGANHG